MQKVLILGACAAVYVLPSIVVFRRANLTHLGGGSASKIDPLNLFLLDCPLFVEAGGGDADCGDDWPDTAGSFGQGQVDPGDRPRPEVVSQHGPAGSAFGRDVLF